MAASSLNAPRAQLTGMEDLGGAVIAGFLAKFGRQDFEAFIDLAICLLDAVDGDADQEFGGDEQDGDFAEDEPAAVLARLRYGPGCIVADPDVGTGGGYCFAHYGNDQSTAPAVW